MSKRQEPCPYCHLWQTSGAGKPLNHKYIQPYDFIDMYVDCSNAEMYVEDELGVFASAPINFCPVCGRDLRKDQS